jgi:hypothetical protein
MPGFMSGIHVFFCGRYRFQGMNSRDIWREEALLPAMTAAPINFRCTPRILKERLTFADPDVISTRPARPGFWRWMGISG